MGMDGLSMANTGIKESTSADFASKTEQAIQSDPSNMSRQVQGATTNRRIREKDENEEQEQQNKKSKNNSEFFNDGFEEQNEENEQGDEEILNDLDEIENPNKEFYVKLNMKDDIIELYDSSTNRLIETISGSELGELVQKLNMASGIFVNKKV